MSRRLRPRKARTKLPVGDFQDTAVRTPAPPRLTKVTGTATATKVPRNLPKSTPSRLAGRERRRSIVPWTRSLLTESKVTTMGKSGITNVAKRKAIRRRTKSGPDAKAGPPRCDSKANAWRVQFSPAPATVTFEEPGGNVTRPYPRASAAATYVWFR